MINQYLIFYKSIFALIELISGGWMARGFPSLPSSKARTWEPGIKPSYLLDILQVAILAYRYLSILTNSFKSLSILLLMYLIFNQVSINHCQSLSIFINPSHLMFDIQGKAATVAVERKAGSYKARTSTSHLLIFSMKFNTDQS